MPNVPVSNKDFIVNGIDVEHAQFPSIVALTVNDGTSEYCTGSLVHKQVVLTAAHCVSLPLELTVVYGSSDLNESCSGCLYKVIETLQHPDYDYALYNGYNFDDMALILLDRPVNDAIITPILPASVQESALQAGLEVTFAGYGRDSMDASGHLYYGIGPIMKFYFPTGEETTAVYYNTKEMVIGEDNPNAPNICYGDSGGPTYVQHLGTTYLTGVTSRIPIDKPVECGHGTVVGLPGPHENWINSNIDNLLDCIEQKKNEKIAEEVQESEDSGPVVIDPVGCNYSGSFNHLQGGGFLLGAIALLSCIRYIKRN